MKPLNTLHTILAATDFSAPSRDAADRAACLAHAAGLPLTLAHAVSSRAVDELRHWLGIGHRAEQHLLDQAGQCLQQLADALAAARQVTVRTRLATGPVLDVIAQQAEAVDAGLLVLGVRGAGGLRRMVLGSTADRLLRRSTRPLLVVRQQAQAPYRRALVGLDFSPWSAQAIETARRVAPEARLVLLNAFEVPFGGKLQLVGVDSPTIEHYRQQARAQAVQHIDTLARQAGLLPGQWQACVVEGEAWQGIVAQAQAQDCDLVVLGKHGQSAAEELLLGSVTKSVLAEGSSDVLVSMAHAA